MLDVLAELLDMVGIHDPRDAGADGEHADLARVGTMQDNVYGVRARRHPCQPSFSMELRITMSGLKMTKRRQTTEGLTRGCAGGTKH